MTETDGMKSMKSGVEWTDEAKDGLRAILSNAQWPLQVRENKINEILDRVDEMKSTPFAAPALTNEGNSDYRKLYLDPFHIVYRVKEVVIEVLNVYHHRMQSPDINADSDL